MKTLISRDTKEHSLPFSLCILWRHDTSQEETVILNIDLGLSVSRTVRSDFLCLSHLAYDIFIMSAGAKTGEVLLNILKIQLRCYRNCLETANPLVLLRLPGQDHLRSQREAKHIGPRREGFIFCLSF
jgi:hypothetical protein